MNQSLPHENWRFVLYVVVMVCPTFFAIWLIPESSGPQRLTTGVTISMIAMWFKPSSFQDRLAWGLLILGQIASGAAVIFAELATNFNSSRVPDLASIFSLFCALAAMVIIIHQSRNSGGVITPHRQDCSTQGLRPDEPREKE